MLDSLITPGSETVKASDTHITVYLNRLRFEAGIARSARHASRGKCAVLRLDVHAAEDMPVNGRILNLAANTLRAGMHDGGVAYLGHGQFAVLLEGTDEREAAAYARTVAGVINAFKMVQDHEVLPVSVCIGGALAEDCQDGAALLEMAEMSAEVARGKPGCKLHLMQANDELLEFVMHDVPARPALDMAEPLLAN